MKNKKKNDCSLSDDDLRGALLEMKTYVDVTEEDLMKIFEIALRHAQKRRISQILVREAMTKHVITITPNADLHEAARVLSVHKISGMPVVDEKNRVLGVISQADIMVTAGMHKKQIFKNILRSILGEPRPTRKIGNKVKDVMNVPPITCNVDDDLRDVAQILDERRIKRMPVVDDEGKILGIIARGDIVKLIGKR
jgi:CBS domain-containing membrane protein